MKRKSTKIAAFERIRDKRLAKAATFEEVLAIALEEITLLPGPVGIVCGPMTTGGKGSYEENLKEFERRINLLREQGKTIFSQLSYEDTMQRIKATPYYKGGNHLLEAFYGPLFQSGAISTWFFIYGWEASVGTTWERNLVTKIGGEKIDLPRD